MNQGWSETRHSFQPKSEQSREVCVRACDPVGGDAAQVAHGPTDAAWNESFWQAGILRLSGVPCTNSKLGAPGAGGMREATCAPLIPSQVADFSRLIKCQVGVALVNDFPAYPGPKMRTCEPLTSSVTIAPDNAALDLLEERGFFS